MKSVFAVLCSVAVLLLSGCAPKISPEQQAILQQTANRPVTCVAGKDCDEKWNRAIEWVNTNSQLKIKTISEHLIQTTGIRIDRGHTAYPAFTIVKYAKGKNTYIIDYSSACDTITECKPSGLELRASFVYFIMGPTPRTAAQQEHIAQMKLIAEEIKTAIITCRDKRIAGELKTYTDSVECSNARIIKIFERTHYPYKDLMQSFIAKRFELAAMVDRKQMKSRCRPI